MGRRSRMEGRLGGSARSTHVYPGQSWEPRLSWRPWFPGCSFGSLWKGCRGVSRAMGAGSPEEGDVCLVLDSCSVSLPCLPPGGQPRSA